ncbi:hypothetical protein CDAR_401371 [Caerostris darwini]|uniref:Uncharacterized protein n=1 Tax=Caerostris darwini TaxID=1538125 RepID=A0AAV4TII7_9ARAC|nr:hypothetical protein CDAR_401371 [Caerostris darwini]
MKDDSPLSPQVGGPSSVVFHNRYITPLCHDSALSIEKKCTQRRSRSLSHHFKALSTKTNFRDESLLSAEEEWNFFPTYTILKEKH